MPPRLLIVDDHPRFRRSAKRLLEIDGWEVVGEAGDGASGLSEAERLQPDVVLLDINLPDSTGFEIASALRRAGSSATVVLTSDRDPSEITPFVEACGARAFLPKHTLSADALRGACFQAP